MHGFGDIAQPKVTVPGIREMIVDHTTNFVSGVARKISFLMNRPTRDPLTIHALGVQVAGAFGIYVQNGSAEDLSHFRPRDLDPDANLYADLRVWPHERPGSVPEPDIDIRLVEIPPLPTVGAHS